MFFSNISQLLIKTEPPQKKSLKKQTMGNGGEGENQQRKTSPPKRSASFYD